MSESYMDGVFFHKATAILAMQNVQTALLRFYALLEEDFPLEGMVVHYFHPRMQALLNLYLIRRNRLDFLGQTLPFSREQVMFLRAFSMTGGVNNIPDSSLSKTGVEVSALLAPHIEDKARAHLVCCLKTAHGSLGLLRLLGPTVNCFKEVHVRRLGMLPLPLGFALVKFLWEDKTKQFLASTGSALDNNELNEVVEPQLIGSSGGLHEVMETVKKLSGTDAPVLILGETGTGKELIANAIQAGSWRRDKAYIKVNCGAIPETLMDSILFGHEKGAFTGAHVTTMGRFEQADGGTLFLDELGELSPQAQVRLLRTLQNHVVERVGSTVSIPVDVRIIAATNRNLENMMQAGHFREDLYHRLNVFPVHMPPLRERLEDLLPLAHHFIKEISRRMKIPPASGIHPVAAEKLLRYHWPGNVRELENLVERALILDYEQSLHLDRYLPESAEREERAGVAKKAGQSELRAMVMACLKELQEERIDTPPIPVERASVKLASLDEAMRRHIQEALASCGGKIHGPGGAAELLEINADTLRKRMARLGIAPACRKHKHDGAAQG